MRGKCVKLEPQFARTGVLALFCSYENIDLIFFFSPPPKKASVLGSVCALLLLLREPACQGDEVTGRCLHRATPSPGRLRLRAEAGNVWTLNQRTCAFSLWSLWFYLDLTDQVAISKADIPVALETEKQAPTGRVIRHHLQEKFPTKKSIIYLVFLLEKSKLWRYLSSPFICCPFLESKAGLMFGEWNGLISCSGAPPKQTLPVWLVRTHHPILTTLYRQ